MSTPSLHPITVNDVRGIVDGKTKDYLGQMYLHIKDVKLTIPKREGMTKTGRSTQISEDTEVLLALLDFSVFLTSTR